jgi:DNA adenine methylase
MKVKAILPWFGGKRTLAPAIVDELGPHTQYFEPFCGSMAVLFAKEPSQKETVNDLHGDLVNLARVLQRIDQAEELYDRLGRVVLCETLLEEAGVYLEDGQARDRDEVDWAYWYFLASWIQRNGVAGTDRQGYQIAVRWTKNGGSPTVRFRHAVESIPAWHARLLNVVVLHRDAFRILDRFEDCVGTAIYCDPPYAADSRTGYTTAAGEHSRYRHELDHDGTAANLLGEKVIDGHERIRNELAIYKRSRVVVSYYDCPRIRELYAGWTFVEKTMRKNLNVQSMRDRKVGQVKDAPEILIINGPSIEGAP